MPPSRRTCPSLRSTSAPDSGYAVRQVLQTLLEVDGFHDAQVTFDASKPSTVPVRLMDTSPARSLLGFEAEAIPGRRPPANAGLVQERPGQPGASLGMAP